MQVESDTFPNTSFEDPIRMTKCEGGAMGPNARKGPKRFLTIIEAAAHIDRHRSTLDKWRAEKIVLPFYKHKKKIMYDIDDLNDYLHSCRVEPVAYGRHSHVNDRLLDGSLEASATQAT
jgi:hypothetical protein